MNNSRFYQYTPQINGVLKNKGVPIENQKVNLSIGLSESGRKINLSTITNEDGEFEFSPVVEDKNQVRFYLAECYVNVVLTAKLSLKETAVIWEGYFDGYEIEDYLKNNMSKLVCDVANPLKYFAFSIDDEESDDYYVNSQCDLFGYIDSGLYGY